MQQTVLVFSVLLEFLHQAIGQIKDPRARSNATTYKVSDGMLAAFSMFFMQCQSFWEHQRQMQSRSGKDNAQSLFGLEKIPSDQQIRNILDLITANSLNSVFEKVYQFLQLGKHLKSYERLCGAVTVWTNPLALIALDPTHSIMEKREWIIGKSYESRILVVVFTMREEAIRIISARPASKSEKKKYAESN